MSTLLADLGNTRLKLYFEGKVSCFSTNNYFDIEEFQRLISAKEFDSVKVVYSTPELVFEKFLDNVGSSSIEIIGSNDVPLDVLTKGTGIDRLLSAYGAYKKWGASIVLDFGTALTVDCVNSKGQFIGGSIGLGFSRIKKEFNESLPHLNFQDGVVNFEGIPSDTSGAILDGVLGTYVAGVQFLTNQYSNCFKDSSPQYVLTGGDADYFEPYFPKSVKEPFLLFDSMLSLPPSS